MRISQFLKQFKLDVKYKFDKKYIVLNILFRLINVNHNKKIIISNYFEFDVFYIYFLIKIFEEFRERFIKSY